MAMRLMTLGGHVLYREPWAAVPPDHRWGNPDHWSAASQHAVAAGRGSAWFVDTPVGRCVLRRYRRGGLVARFIKQHYLYLGAERTRAFREFRLLEHLFDHGLPVPEPIFASFSARLGWYQATLMTRTIDGARSMAQRLADGDLTEQEIRAIGATIRRFHDSEVCHADLNAHNILLTSDGVHLIDFDRGTIGGRGDFKVRNLNRLDRSVAKLGHPSVRALIDEGYASAGHDGRDRT